MYSNKYKLFCMLEGGMRREAMQSNIVKTVEMGHVVILNRVIRVSLSGKVAFKQKFERVKRGHVYIWLVQMSFGGVTKG